MQLGKASKPRRGTNNNTGTSKMQGGLPCHVIRGWRADTQVGGREGTSPLGSSFNFSTPPFAWIRWRLESGFET
ncbi:hypothetical protein V6N13_143828 [Hibiscus sabdariffa]